MFAGWRSKSNRTPEGDRPALPTRAGIAVASSALALLFVSLLGPSSTVPLFCLIVALGIGWRIRHAGLLAAAAVAVIANTVVLPTGIMPSSGSLVWTWLPIWCLEGLLINWLLIQLYKDLNDRSSAEEFPPSASDLSPGEESTLHVLIESSRQSHDRLRLMVESIGEYAIVMLTPEGRVASWNVGAERILGYRAEEILGRNHAEFYVPEDVHLQVPDRHIELSKTAGTFEAEGWRRRKDNTRFWAHVGVSPMRSLSGSLLGFAVVIRDLTEKRRVEELRVAKEAAEAASHAKDQFLAILSHELRTPLTPILLATSNLLEQEDAGAEVRSTLAMIHRNAKLEARLIDDLLDITRATTGRLTLSLACVDVHRVIQHAAEVCRAEITDSQLVLDLQLSASGHCVCGDPARLQQVFWNLIKNAAKFTPPGGIITIRTWNSSGEEGGETHLLVEVSDTGIGIHADRLPRIFNAFEQKAPEQQRRYGGLGLGLAISRSVIETHGGRLSVASEGENRGATLTVEFMTLCGPCSNIVTIDGPGASLKGTSEAQGLTILLIDDNRDTLKYVASLLQQRGHQVNPAFNFRTARKLAEANTYDLVISDIELPDGSGLDLMRELTIRQPTPGIALSGFGTVDDVAMSLQAGFAEHLIKPIEFRNLEEAIRRVAKTRPLDHRQVNKELPLLQVTATKPNHAGVGSSSSPAQSRRHNGNVSQEIGR